MTILSFEAAKVARGLAAPRRFAIGDAVTIPSKSAVQTYYDQFGRLRLRSVPLRGTVIALLPPIVAAGRSTGWRYRVMIDFGATVAPESDLLPGHLTAIEPTHPRPAA